MVVQEWRHHIAARFALLVPTHSTVTATKGNPSEQGGAAFLEDDPAAPAPAAPAPAAVQLRDATSCLVYTAPKDNEWITQPGTTTSDNKIESCTNCKATEYYTRNCSATSNRLCTACEACPTGKYQTSECGDNFDTLCADVAPTACTDKQYQVDTPTTVDGYECKDVRICALDEYTTVEPTKTSDRQCAPKNICSTTQFQSGTNPKGAVCTECRMCPPGTEPSGGCTGEKDTDCAVRTEKPATEKPAEQSAPAS